MYGKHYGGCEQSVLLSTDRPGESNRFVAKLRIDIIQNKLPSICENYLKPQ